MRMGVKMFKQTLAAMAGVALAAALAACDPAETPDQPPTPEMQPSEEDVGAVRGPQALPEPRPSPQQRAEGSPETAVEAFFEALRAEDSQQAANLISRDALTVDPEQLEQDVAQMARTLPEDEEPVRALDAHTEGDYAIVATRFAHAEAQEDTREVRPVVLVQEDAQWRLVWELIGMDFAQAQQVSPLALQLEPLYRWYESREEELALEAAAAEG
jgi:ketosteroid isomerase-like protein